MLLSSFPGVSSQLKGEKDEPKPPKASGNTPVLDRLMETMEEDADGAGDKKARRRSRTISDMRSQSVKEDNSSKENKILIWIEQTIEESILAQDLIVALRSGDVLIRFIAVVQPQVSNPFLGKGDAFAIQKVAFFLQACRQLGMHDRDLFTQSDLESGNKARMVVTFLTLSEKVRAPIRPIGPLLFVLTLVAMVAQGDWIPRSSPRWPKCGPSARG